MIPFLKQINFGVLRVRMEQVAIAAAFPQRAVVMRIIVVTDCIFVFKVGFCRNGEGSAPNISASPGQPVGLADVPLPSLFRIADEIDSLAETDVQLHASIDNCPFVALLVTLHRSA